MTEISIIPSCFKPRSNFSNRSDGFFAVKSIQSIERLKHISNNKKVYRSGAWYIGKLNGTERTGWGQFCSSGGLYEGFYSKNKRNGEGKYIWSDGSVYIGSFKDDLKHGEGTLTWSNGECYSGHFLDDMRHGYGVYTWPDSGKYEGYFQYNLKSGFGTFVMKNGDQFQGFYKQDQRFGPGIFTCKESGAQDVGIWKGSMLVQLCTVMNTAFMYENYADHSINAGGVSPGHMFTNTNKIVSISNLLAGLEDVCIECPPGFPRDQILKGIRHFKSPKGSMEEASERFILAASLGDVNFVKSALQNRIVDANVCDSTGYSSILAAAVNCHIDVLNCLLDYGANINLLTNEGLSALSACHILLYTEQDFLENIAENMAKENLFNTVEIEKRTGTVINRNERKKVMSVYEASYATYSVNKHRFRKLKAVIKAIQVDDLESGGSSPTSKRNYTSSDDDINEDDTANNYDEWKMEYYQKSMQYVKEVENINKTFRIFMLNPTGKNENKLWCTDGLNSSLSNGQDSSAQMKNMEMLNTTVASICGYNAPSQKTFATHCNRPTIRSAVMTRLLYNERKPHLQQTIKLLLKRGADPNSSELPMPPLFFAVKSADVEAIHSLLKRNARTTGRMKTLNLSPLHVAVALPCPEALTITDLLLKFGANPNLRDGYMDGRTALHVVCAREDDFQLAQNIAQLLLANKADPNILCAGNSALSLAIASGNDLIFGTLLEYKADLSLKLTHGLGSALAVATSFQAERHRTPSERIKTIDKLIQFGADLLTPVRISDRFPPGTVVDYAYHVFTQDRRIACTPYHALSSLERECFNARKYMLEKLGIYLRAAALRKEEELANEVNGGLTPELDKKRLHSTNSPNRRSKTPIQDGAGGRDPTCGLRWQLIKVAGKDGVPQYKKRLRYCYGCGRSIGVRLSACTRCKEVFYCSKNCKMKAWNSRHRDECGRAAGVKFRTDLKSDSPTPTSNALETAKIRPKTTPTTTLHQTHLRRTRYNTSTDNHFLPQL